MRWLAGVKEHGREPAGVLGSRWPPYVISQYKNWSLTFHQQIMILAPDKKSGFSLASIGEFG